MTITSEEIEALVDEMRRGAQAWIDGRLEHTAATRMTQAEDMTIFGPFGGHASRNGPELASRQAQVVSKFQGGTSQCELVNAMTSGDLVVLVMIERNTVTFEGRDKPHPWVLRTTQVFRKQGDMWLRLHRHADPLIKPRSLDDTLDLAADRPAN
jgi:ketosteroid isomerase-like protein